MKQVVLKGSRNRKLRVYISGKMSGLDEAESKRLFNAAQQRLEAEGHIVINPWNIHHGPFCNKWEDYLIEDLWYLKQCDAIYFLENYKDDSCGAMVEYWFAKGRSIPMLFEGEEQG